jgi:hypothetical protein
MVGQSYNYLSATQWKHIALHGDVQAMLTSELDGNERLASRSGHFIFGKYPLQLNGYVKLTV